MTPKRNRNWVLAAVAAASLISVPAMAQVAAQQTGHASDANTRVGSGGFNDAVGNGGVSQNQIIYGNVTGLGGFSGPHTADPRQFLGPSPGALVDNFIRTSGGPPTPYQPATIQNAPQGYYGSSRYVAPPVGTERLGATGAYVTTNLTPNNPNSNPLLDNAIASTDLLKQKYGDTSILGAGSKALDNTELSDFLGRGVTDAQIQPTLYANSPLFGLQPLPGEQDTGLGSDNLPLYSLPSASLGGSARQRLRQNDRDRMQQEVTDTAGANQLQAQPFDGSLAGGNLNKPLDGPPDANLNSQNKNGPGGQPSSLNSSLNMQEKVSQRQTTLVPGRQQSKTLAVLQDRLKQYQSAQFQQIQANVDAQNARAMQLKNGKMTAPTSQPGNAPRLGTGMMGSSAGLGATENRPPAITLPPSSVPATDVTSLAEGVSAPGLHDLLLSAEDLMRQGKFESAIKKYNNAEDVVPNNSLIPLGRANAELGAGYYNQASVDLHQAFESDPSLLLGRYALKKWMSDKRLDFVTKELADLANGDKTQEMPVFLLAYISYNTDQDAKAFEYLQEAKKRAGNNDAILTQLETRWKPAAAGGVPTTPDLKK